MIENKKPNIYWSKELCAKEASKYNSRTQFRKNSCGAYTKAHREKWINDICVHMKEGKNPNGYWTYEKCKEKASKYLTRTEFKNNSSSAYTKAKDNKWLDEICSHMIVQGNTHLKFVYVFEFSDNSAYIGLTQNIKERERDHLKSVKSAINKHIKETGTTYTIKQITKDPISKEEAQELEHNTIIKYLTEGWNVLNKGNTGKGIGSVGGNIIIWTYEKCKEEALKFKTKVEFQKKSKGASYACYKNNWFKELTSHMLRPVSIKKIWTYEKCFEEAKQYTKRSDFKSKSKSAYQGAQRLGILNDICLHMIVGNKRKDFWTYEKCKEEALKYDNKTNFILYSRNAYNIAKDNKWLDDIYLHMIKK